MQLLPRGGSGAVQASSEAAKRAESAGKTHCQVCPSLLTDTIQKRYIKLTGTMHTRDIMGTSQRKEAMIWKHVTLFIIL